jgi:hypothetical protein
MEFPIFFNRARLGEDDGIFFRACVEEAKRKLNALWYFTPQSSTPLVSEGEPYPDSARFRVKNVEVLAGRSPSRYVAWLVGGLNITNVFIREGERWIVLAKQFSLQPQAVAELVYLEPHSPALAHLLSFQTQQSLASYTTFSSYRGLGFFDGEKILGLLPGQTFLPLGIRAAPQGGGYSGLLVFGEIGSGGARAGAPIALYLDLAEAAKNLQPVPVVGEVDGVAIALSQVARWFGDGTALVTLPGGLYLYTPRREPPSAVGTPSARSRRALSNRGGFDTGRARSPLLPARVEGRSYPQGR